MSEISFTRVGDYFLPNITLSAPSPEQAEPLGKYGRMHKAYLREHRPILYNQLLLSERLYPNVIKLRPSVIERHIALGVNHSWV